MLTIVGIVVVVVTVGGGAGGCGGTNRLMMTQQHEEETQQCHNVNRISAIRQHVWIFGALFLDFFFFLFICAVCV